MAKTKTDLYLECPCGAKSPVWQNKDGKWHSHCVSCGRLTFWSNPMLTERIRFGGKPCPHNLVLKNCKNGSKTGFCQICRTRVFVPGDK